MPNSSNRDVPNRTVWIDASAPESVQIIDQRDLPFDVTTLAIASVDAMADAIRDMAVRGAGCIGVAAGYGMYLAAAEAVGLDGDAGAEHLGAAATQLSQTRPTAANLDWAIDRQLRALDDLTDGPERLRVARKVADAIADEDVASCRSIGEHGVEILRALHAEHQRPINVLTHCNAGWLAFVEHGSATAPIYAANDAGIPVHVFVGETRPRNQGSLTAWELSRRGVPHTMVVDNAIGHLMQQGEVDLVIVGADRVTWHGDAANKIGTYLRALSARANRVPFYVALPSSTLDPTAGDGLVDIEIEERSADEVTHVAGTTDAGVSKVRTIGSDTPVRNPAFDVTPAELITGLITERGVCAANAESIAAMFPDLEVDG